MKRAAIIVILSTLALPAQAANKSLELLIGPLLPVTKVQNGSAEDDLASPGIAVGGRFLVDVNKAISAGVELQSLNPGERKSTVLLANTDTASKFNSIVALADVKLALPGTIRPFVLGGLGFHSTHATANSTPLAGFVWGDTGTRETRTTVDSTKNSIAATLQGGVDFPIQDRLTLGVSAAWYYLGKATYDTISGSISSIAFLGSVAYRF